MCTYVQVRAWLCSCAHTRMGMIALVCTQRRAYVCIHTRVNIITLVCTYIHRWAWSRLCVHTCMCVDMIAIMCTSMHVLTWSRLCVHTYTCGHDGAFVCIYARLNMIALMCTYIHVLAWSLLCVRTYKCGHDRAFVYIKMWALLRLCVHTYMDGHDHADVYLHTCYCNICTHRNTQANNVYVWAWSRICVHKREGTLCLCVHTRTCGHDHAQVYIHRWAWSHSCVLCMIWMMAPLCTYMWGHDNNYENIHVRAC